MTVLHYILIALEVVLIFNLITDLVYRIVDPRIEFAT